MPVRQLLYLRHGGQVAASQTGLEVAAARMPKSGRVRSVHLFARAVSGTVTVDIHKNDVSILTAVITPTAGSQIAGSLDLSKTAFTNGDEIQMKVTTAASSTLDDGAVSLYLA